MTLSHLSSLSFASDFLQTLINDAMSYGKLDRPLRNFCPDFPMIQYVDDTLVIMRAYQAQLQLLEEILDSYANASGLKVNYYKSFLVPININSEMVHSFSVNMAPSLSYTLEFL